MFARIVTLSLIACGPATYALPDVPVTGGTDEQVAIVRDGLAAFDDGVGTGRVELSTVWFVGGSELDGAFARYWDGATRWIRIHEGIGGESLRTVLRHELCHALDHQDLRQRDVERHLREVDGEALADALGLLAQPEHDRALAETFANLCMSGPEVAHLAQHRCPADPRGEVPWDWLAEDVWAGVPSLAEVPPVAPLAEVVLPVRADVPYALQVEGGRARARAAVRVKGQVGEAGFAMVVDPWSGVPLAVSAAASFEAAEPDPLERDLGEATVVRGAEGPQGAALFVEVAWADHGPFGRGLSRARPAGAPHRFAEWDIGPAACGESWPFVVDGAPWVGWMVGPGVVGWGPVGEVDDAR